MASQLMHQAYSPEATGRQLRGEVLASITRSLIKLHKQHFGRGATKGRTFYVHDDLVICEMRDVLTPVERTLIQKGQRDTVRATRYEFQHAMRDEFIGAIESITGREVETYESTTFTALDTLLEIFYLEPSGAGSDTP